MKNLKQLTIAVFVLTCATSCRMVKPLYPVLPQSALDTKPLPVSNVNIPITVDCKNIFDQVEKEVPKYFTSGGINQPPIWIEDWCNKKYIWEVGREALNLSFTNDVNNLKLNLTTVARYRGAGAWRLCVDVWGWCVCDPFWVYGSCGYDKSYNAQLLPELMKHTPKKWLNPKGELMTPPSYFKDKYKENIKKIASSDFIIDSTSDATFNKNFIKGLKFREAPRRMGVGISSTISVQTDWKLKTNTKPYLDAIDKCEITILDIDITDRIKGLANGPIQGACNTFDNETSKIDIKSKAEPLWKGLFNTFPIESYGFFQINPSQIRLSKLSGAGNNVNFVLGISAQPYFSLTKPQDEVATPLPNIAECLIGNDFNVYVQGDLQYDPLSKIFNDAVVGLGRIPVDANPKHYIQFTQGKVFGVGNNQLLIKVKVKGKYGFLKTKGWLYLKGTPTYNKSTHILALNNVEFTAETNNILINALAWLKNADIENKIQQNAQWDITNKIIDIKTKMETAMNQKLADGVNLNGKVNNLDINGVLAIDNALIIRVLTNGDLSLNIKE